jgi:ABC-type multidrug transport system fused ATPase/permease subunit
MDAISRTTRSKSSNESRIDIRSREQPSTSQRNSSVEVAEGGNTLEDGDQRDSDEDGDGGDGGLSCVICDGSWGGLSYCSLCDATLCEVCWAYQVPHKRPQLLIHVRLDSVFCSIFRECRAKRNSFNSNIPHEWFRTMPGCSVPIQWTDRYHNLSLGLKRCATLVSFVGDFGSGKSVLIKALMKVSGLSDGASFSYKLHFVLADFAF